VSPVAAHGEITKDRKDANFAKNKDIKNANDSNECGGQSRLPLLGSSC
jgi:hypothetical protein